MPKSLHEIFENILGPQADLILIMCLTNPGQSTASQQIATKRTKNGMVRKDMAEKVINI